jgi:hypothetical protein
MKSILGPVAQEQLVALAADQTDLARFTAGTWSEKNCGLKYVSTAF